MFDAGDEAILTELAKSLSVSQMADKWDCDYQKMYNYLYRRGIKAQKFKQPGRKPNRKKHAELMAKIKSLALSGVPSKLIAMKVDRQPEYVSKVLQGLRISATAEKRRIMLNKYRSAKVAAARMGMTLPNLCLIEYGWSKYKTGYAAKLDKKSPDQQGKGTTGE